MTANVSRISSLLDRTVRRPLHIGSSHTHLLRLYADKSDSGKYAQLNVDTNRIYFPGDNVAATIVLYQQSFDDLEAVEIEFKGEVHTFGFSQLGASTAPGSTGGNAQLQLEKQVFLGNSAKMQLPSMQCRDTQGPISLSQRSKEEPLVIDAEVRLPSYLIGGKEAGKRLALPAIYHDGNFNEQVAYVTYHWKLTTHRKSNIKSIERLWKPIMVMSLPLEAVFPDPLLFQSLSYPPHHLMNSYGMYREVKKYLLKRAALMEFELAVPSIEAWPM